MEKRFILALSLAAFLAVPSCTVEKASNEGASSSAKSIHFLTSEKCCGEENQVAEKKEKAKYPSFRKYKVKSQLNYLIAISGGNQIHANIKVGEFEANGLDMKFYAALAKNGLVTVTSRAIMAPDGRTYTNWLNVSLTEKGKSYIYTSECSDRTEHLLKGDFKEYFNPVKNKDEYGDFLADENISENARTVLNAFYSQYLLDQAKAIDQFGDAELRAAYKRMTDYSVYCKHVHCPAPQVENVFTAGIRTIDQNFRFYRIPKYVNTYKAVFKGGSVLVILDESQVKISDVVLDENKNITFKTVNKSISNDRIRKCYEQTKTKCAKEESPAKPVYYAPGLIAREWSAAGLVRADRGNKYIYNVTKANANCTYVPVRLYDVEIDRIFKVTRFANEANPQVFGSEHEYYADAEVIFKKVNMTPFQFIMQFYGLANTISDQNLYVKDRIQLQYFQDCGWNFAKGSTYIPEAILAGDPKIIF